MLEHIGGEHDVHRRIGHREMQHVGAREACPEALATRAQARAREIDADPLRAALREIGTEQSAAASEVERALLVQAIA